MPGINDGWTIEGRFPGQGWSSPFNYKFRPALNARVTEYREAIKNVPAKVITAKQIEFLREHLTSWELTDRAGTALTLTDDDAYKMLSDAAVSYLWSDIAGYGADQWQTAGKN